ncbi:MAG TPA: hypothetical protein VGM03_19965 [Phycisphaerae bacterium]
MKDRRRFVVQWTETAKKGLAKLPPKVRRGLLEKADALTQGDTSNAKPLVGALQGYYRIAYSRYRAIYTQIEERRPKGDSLITIRFLFVAAGIRKEGDKRDIYNLALRLIRLGVLDDVRESSRDAPEEQA